MSKSHFIKEQSLRILLAFVENHKVSTIQLSELVKASVKAAEELYEECEKYEEKTKSAVPANMPKAGAM
jgi:predicted transcriptional regulator